MKLKLLLLLGVFFTISSPLCAQKADSLYRLADSLRYEFKYREALPVFHELMELIEPDAPNVTLVLYGIAECHYWLREHEEAEFYYLDILDRIGDSTDEFNRRLFYVTTRLGYLYLYRTQKWKKALAYFKKEHDIIAAFKDESAVTDVRQFRNAYNLASTSRLLYDYNTALNYAFEALSIAQNQSGNNTNNLSFAYSVIANILYDLDRWDEATDYYLKKIDLNIAANGPNAADVGNDYTNLASNLIETKEYERAKEYLDKALKILNTKNPDRKILSDTYRTLGEASFANDELEQAETYFRKAIKVIKEPLPAQNAEAHEWLAKVFERQQLYDSALTYYQQAMRALLDDFQWNSLAENPTAEQLFNEPYNHRLLSLKAACWLQKYKAFGNQADLRNAHEAFELMDEVTENYRNNFTLESSKLFFQDWNYEHYVGALESVYELYQANSDEELMNQAWALVEKNKSLLMLENLLSSERLDESNLPDSVKNRQSEASQEIWNLQRDIRECDINSDCNDDQLIKLRAALAYAESSLATSRQIIRSQFPDYYSITQDKVILPLAQLTDYLSGNQLLINYFATDSAYFALASNGEKTVFNKIMRNTELDSMLNLFLTESSGVSLAQGDLNKSYLEFTTASHFVYQNLLEPLLQGFEVEELIIIPDGLLALTPFEALISSKPASANGSYANLEYIIYDYKIQFGYSATLWSKNKEDRVLESDASLLALGTSGERNQKNLARLTGTTQEASALAALPNASVFIGDEATEQNFKTASQNADIIHLALHNVNDQNNPLNSQLIFNDSTELEDGALHLYELFGLEITPSLVVLSACETGVSEWQKGEGPYHIGRGFLYHGNPAMVLSLWKVKDFASAHIMKQYYDNLHEGHSSSKSLRAAKLNFLASADNIMAHPNNWASLINIGDCMIKKPKGYPSFVPYLILVVFLVFVFSTLIIKLNKGYNTISN